MKNKTNIDKTKKKLKPRSRIWLEVNEKVVFGSGRLALFRAIEDTGSIRQAAEKIGMSYRAAWGKIKATEERLDIKLVATQAGGRKSGAELTTQGKELLRTYEKFREDLETSLEETFAHYFGD